MATQNASHPGCDYIRLHEVGGREHEPGNAGASRSWKRQGNVILSQDLLKETQTRQS